MLKILKISKKKIIELQVVGSSSNQELLKMWDLL